MDVDIKHLEGFTGLWIPEEILSDRNLSALEVLLYAEIHALTKNEKGYCFATNNYIAWRLRGVTGNSISKIISHLEKKNYISVKIINSIKSVDSFVSRSAVLFRNMILFFS